MELYLTNSPCACVQLRGRWWQVLAVKRNKILVPSIYVRQRVKSANWQKIKWRRMKQTFSFQTLSGTLSLVTSHVTFLSVNSFDRPEMENESQCNWMRHVIANAHFPLFAPRLVSFQSLASKWTDKKYCQRMTTIREQCRQMRNGKTKLKTKKHISANCVLTLKSTYDKSGTEKPTHTNTHYKYKYLFKHVVVMVVK